LDPTEYVFSFEDGSRANSGDNVFICTLKNVTHQEKKYAGEKKAPD
jgi:hypothetical protein